MQKINLKSLYQIANLKIVPRKREKLVCSHCGKHPHWFGKFCSLKAELDFLAL